MDGGTIPTEKKQKKLPYPMVCRHDLFPHIWIDPQLGHTGLPETQETCSLISTLRVAQNFVLSAHLFFSARGFTALDTESRGKKRGSLFFWQRGLFQVGVEFGGLIDGTKSGKTG